MIRSILVALDDTEGARAARDAAIALARRTGAALTAAVVLDRPHTMNEHEPVPIGAGAFKERRDAALTARAEQEAEAAFAACREAAGDLPFETLRLEDAPEPALLRASATHDLVVIGRDSTLGMEETEDSFAPVIEGLLRNGARPVLIIPPGPLPPAEGPVLVAYDGSVPSMRALQSFALLGLAEQSPVRVASVADDPAEASALAGDGATYLRRHGVKAEPVAIAADHAWEALLGEANGLQARLMVAGAFGTGGLKAMLLGSVTRQVLRKASCPVFVSR